MTNKILLRDSDGKTLDLEKQEAEQCEEYSGSKRVAQLPDFLIQRIAYTSDGKQEYIGFAKPGTDVSASGWQIKKLSYSGFNIISILYAGGNLGFDKIWDDRESYSYS